MNFVYPNSFSVQQILMWRSAIKPKYRIRKIIFVYLPIETILDAANRNVVIEILERSQQIKRLIA